MFAIGGSNYRVPKVETWSVHLPKSKGGQFEDLLLNSALTGWEIQDSSRVVYSFNLIYSRTAHTSISIEGDYIYSIGGKDQDSARVYERYQLDGRSEKCGELSNPRYYASSCDFSHKFIYIYGGYSFETGQLLNTIEIIDHSAPNVGTKMVEIEIPALNGSLLKQYDENTLLILGGKSKLFSQNAIYFDVNTTDTRVEDFFDKSVDTNPKRLFYYQSDCVINVGEEEHKDILLVDTLNFDYKLISVKNL